MDKLPYIAKIVDAYQTSNGNFFCREEGKSISERPLDWPIFVDGQHADKMNDLPIFGIVVIDHNSNFFNGKSRPTCRVLSKDRRHLEKIIEEENELNESIHEAVEHKKRMLAMTLNELKSILKSRTFKSSVKDRNEHHQFTFTEIYIFRDGKPLGIYELTEGKDGFTIVVVQKLDAIFTGTFNNIILQVQGDSRFPIIINFDGLALQQGKGLDITLEAI